MEHNEAPEDSNLPFVEDESHKTYDDHFFAKEIGLGRPIDIRGQDFKKIEEQIKNLKKADYDSLVSHF